jgi:putative peptidoglycan lipid II flippase
VRRARAESVRFATIVLAIARLARFSLGFIATLLIARAFGTRAETDAFFVAWILPVVFMDWAGNILKVGFIPTYARLRALDGDPEADRVAGQVAAYLTAASAGATLAVLLAASPIVRALAPGFNDSTHGIGVGMLRVLAPSLIASAIFFTLETILNARQHFSSPARARVLGRVVVVVALVALGGPLGATAMPVSFLLGSFAQLLAAGGIGWETMRALGPTWRPLLPGTREVGRLLIPALFWMLLDQLKFLVDQAFASTLADGQLSALNYAFRITQFVITVSAGAYVTALFPRLSEMTAAREDVAGAATAAARRVLIASVYFMCVLVALSEPIVRFLLERGAFTGASTAWTAGALAWFAPTVATISVNMLLKTLIFLARQARVIVIVGVSELLLNLVLDAALVRSMGVRGLALATSATTLVLLLALPRHLEREGLLHVRPLTATAVRLLPGSLLCLAVVHLVARWMAGTALSWVALGLGLAGAAAIGAAIYVVAAQRSGLDVLGELRPFLVRGARQR